MRSEDSASCSNATLHGSYAFHATGERFAAVARFTFDGRGGLTATFFGRSPGNPFGPIEFTGTAAKAVGSEFNRWRVAATRLSIRFSEIR
jgi:hypothetical protein